MEKKERSVPDDAPGVEIPDDNDQDDLRDADELEQLGEALPPDSGED